jgi:beta-galactosidase
MKKLTALLLLIVISASCYVHAQSGSTHKFNQDWKFLLGDDPLVASDNYNDAAWRSLNLPHDWSIELPFDSASPTGTGGGALREAPDGIEKLSLSLLLQKIKQ